MTEDWYCNFHPFDGGRDWDDAVRFGFVAHGYGEAYVRPFSRLEVDDRVRVRLARNKDSNAPTGFVGRGVVVTPPQPVATARIVVDGREESFLSLLGRMRGHYEDLPGYDGEWVAGVRWATVRSVNDRLMFDVVPFANQNTTVRFDTSRDDHAAILQTLERELPASALGTRTGVAQDELLACEEAALEVALDSSVTGQGYAVDPRAVELVGMTAVSDYFTGRGWTVLDVSQDKCGWDLEASRGDKRWCVEVKACSGGLPTVLLTKNELAKAAEHPDWVLAVVTRALTAPEPVRFFTSAQATASAKAVVYRALLDHESGTDTPRRAST